MASAGGDARANAAGGSGKMEGAGEGHDEWAGPSAKLSEQHLTSLIIQVKSIFVTSTKTFH